MNKWETREVIDFTSELLGYNPKSKRVLEKYFKSKKLKGKD